MAHRDLQKEDKETVYQFKDDVNDEENDENICNSFDTLQNARYSVTDGNFKIMLRSKPKIIKS